MARTQARAEEIEERARLLKEEAEELRRERDQVQAELSKVYVSEQTISERYEGSLIKLQEDNAELHSRITRLNKANQSLQEQVSRTAVPHTYPYNYHHRCMPRFRSAPLTPVLPSSGGLPP